MLGDIWAMQLQPWESQDNWLSCGEGDEQQCSLTMSKTDLKLEGFGAMCDVTGTHKTSVDGLYSQGMLQLSDGELQFSHVVSIYKVASRSELIRVN